MADFERLYGNVGATGRNAQSVELDITGATTTTLYTPSANGVFALRSFYMVNLNATVVQQVQFLSGSTGIWIATVHAFGTSIIHGDDLALGNGLGILMLGRANGEALKIVTVGSGGPIQGGVMVDEVTLR